MRKNRVNKLNLPALWKLEFKFNLLPPHNIKSIESLYPQKSSVGYPKPLMWFILKRKKTKQSDRNFDITNSCFIKQFQILIILVIFWTIITLTDLILQFVFRKTLDIFSFFEISFTPNLNSNRWGVDRLWVDNCLLEITYLFCYWSGYICIFSLIFSS